MMKKQIEVEAECAQSPELEIMTKSDIFHAAHNFTIVNALLNSLDCTARTRFTTCQRKK